MGPPLSLFRANWTPRRIFWSTKDPINTFGQGVMDTVKEADPNAVIWDTRTQGRPDMVAITWQLVKECNAVGKKNGFKPIEILEGIILTADEWTPESGLVTAAQKVQRRKVAEHYAMEIKVCGYIACAE